MANHNHVKHNLGQRLVNIYMFLRNPYSCRWGLNWGLNCNSVKQHYGVFCVREPKVSEQFDWDDDRMDSFFYRLLFHKTSYDKIWTTVQLYLFFSHGQACSERGLNKEMLNTKMGKDTMTALRLVQSLLE